MPDPIPPCTPVPKCQQDVAGHIRPPICPHPEKCLARSEKRGTKKRCASALAQVKGRRDNCACRDAMKKTPCMKSIDCKKRKKKKCVIL